MSNKTIYDGLRSAGMSKEAACGLMGNMMAESGMKSNIAQRGMTSLSDAEYTNRADTGMLDFVHDSVGYGLCQWTYWSRKQALLNYARAMGVSVGDEAMQVQFCISELKSDYPKLWEYLCSSHDLFQCSQKVCYDYERPATNNVGTRYAYAQEFFDEFANHTPAPRPEPEPVVREDWKVRLIQYVMSVDGYWDEPDGLKSEEFFSALRRYTDDMEAC